MQLLFYNKKQFEGSQEKSARENTFLQNMRVVCVATGPTVSSKKFSTKKILTKHNKLHRSVKKYFRTLEQAGANICSMGYQNSNFKIGLSLFGCAEKYTEQSTHCAVWMRRWVFKWSTRPNDLLNSLPFTFTVYHISMFLPHMLSETTRFCTCVITFCALVWLFSSVNADVPLQSSCSVEWAPALFTVMCLLSTVGEKMLGKIFFVIEENSHQFHWLGFSVECVLMWSLR